MMISSSSSSNSNSNLLADNNSDVHNTNPSIVFSSKNNPSTTPSTMSPESSVFSSFPLSKPCLHFVNGAQQHHTVVFECREGWRVNDPKTKHPHSTTHNCSIKDYLVIEGNDFENCKSFLKLKDSAGGKVVTETFFTYDPKTRKHVVEFQVVSKINNMKGNTSSRVAYIDIYDSNNKLICVSDSFWVRSRSRGQMMLDLAKRRKEPASSKQTSASAESATVRSHSTTSSNDSPSSDDDNDDGDEEHHHHHSTRSNSIIDEVLTSMQQSSIPSIITTTARQQQQQQHKQSSILIHSPLSSTNQSSTTTDPLSSLANVASSIVPQGKERLPSFADLTLSSPPMPSSTSTTSTPGTPQQESSLVIVSPTTMKDSSLPHIDCITSDLPYRKRKISEDSRIRSLTLQIEKNSSDISKLYQLVEEQNKMISDLSLTIVRLSKKQKQQ